MNGMTTRRLLLATVLVIFFAATCVAEDAAELPRGLSVSNAYSLTVDGKPVRVLETVKADNHGTNNVNRMSFAGFDCKDAAVVKLRVDRPFRSVELRPRRCGVKLRRNGNFLEFPVKPLRQLTLVFDNDYDHALVIAPNPIHVAPKPDEVNHYFASGLHRLDERLSLKSSDRVYLAEGAIVCGAFDLKQVNDVQIYGRGIVYGGETPHQENYRVFAGDATKDVVIDGITVCNAPGWIVSFWSGNENLAVRNVKMLGNFRYNTDGVQTGTTGLLVENCYLQCNDDNFSLNGICRDVTVRNNVLWNLYNGGVFMLGWATGTHFQLENHRIHDNTILRCGGCCDYDRKAPFSMKLFGSHRTAKDIEFRNIDVEDIAAFGRWIDLQAGKATNSEVADIRFENINIDASWLIEGEIRGNAEGNVVSGVSFKNVKFTGDRLMDTPEVGRLSLVHTKGTTLEGKSFADIELKPEPIPEAATSMATRPSNTPSSTPAASVSVLSKAPNLLANGNFQNGTDGWQLPSRGRGEARIIKDGEHVAVLISNRRDASVGLKLDVTELLLKHGQGSYLYGVTAKAAENELRIKATLVIEDENGIQQHPSPDLLVTSNAFATAARTQSLSWSKLKRATLKVESGYGDKHDFVVSEVFLKK